MILTEWGWSLAASRVRREKDLRPFLWEVVAYDIDIGGGHWLLTEYAERKT